MEMYKMMPLLALLVVSVSHTAFAYSAIPTHEAITEKAIAVSKIKQYLQDNLNIDPADFDNIYEPQIIIGSNQEDVKDRPRNHFHNPITNQGLSDFFEGISARTWVNSPINEWSWKQIRDYYYQAMTATTDVLRNDLFFQMFEGLGHVAHLIQDMSVPEHVRNDQHVITVFPIIGWNEYEPWVRSNIDPLKFNASAFSFPPNFLLQNFWDADTYVNSPLQQTAMIGLAEYTSYNFLSQDTIFTEDRPTSDPHYFPHPRKEFTNAILIEQIAEDGEHDQVYYVHGYQTNRLAVYSFFHRYLIPLDAFGEWRYHFDTLVYEEYAGRLIPQAVTYSAGLLNYFFRGEVDAQADGNDGIKITNHSNEAMNGAFALYYDDKDGNRKQVVGASWTLPLAPGETSERKAFTMPDDADEPGKYILVFRGTLGAESDAVVGKIVTLTKADYVFIIQESAELKSVPIENDTFSFNSVFHEKRQFSCPQTIKGRFLVYGSIQRISLKRIIGYSNIQQLSINGQTVLNNTWVAGSSTDEPKTWQVELCPSGMSAPADAPWLEVQLSNGDVFTQPVLMYDSAIQVVAKSYRTTIEFFDGIFSRYRSSVLYIKDSTLAQPADKRPTSIPGLGTLLTSEQFKFIQVNNHTPEESFNHNYVDHGFFLQDRLEVGFGAGGEFGYFQSFDEPFTDCINTRTQFCSNYEAISLPEPFPLTLTAQMDRIYLQRELDHLKTKGVKPEYYSIIFK